jgi:peptidoglycan hydrolase CwlO-like protein
MRDIENLENQQRRLRNLLAIVEDKYINLDINTKEYWEREESLKKQIERLDREINSLIDT